MFLVASPASADSLRLFQSPTRNIGCEIDLFGSGHHPGRGGIRCDIAERSWATPATPKSCHFDYGNGLEVRNGGRGHFACASDTVLGQGPILAYGRTVRLKRYKCTSLTIGMRCVNRKTGHGFKLSREHARRF